MGFIDSVFKKIRAGRKAAEQEYEEHAYCPRCSAVLTFQNGFSDDLNYWVCKSCGEMLINPGIDTEDDIAWICDNCESMMNIQEGFEYNNGEWVCTECGYVNKITESEVYASEAERIAAHNSPYYGLSDEDALYLSAYTDISYIDGRQDIILVRHKETGGKYIKKLLRTYDRSVYEFLKAIPVPHIPTVYEICESGNCLIVIEEFIKGRTIADILEEKVLSEEQAVGIGIELCEILDNIHSLSKPIIHRDIKPSNIVITPKNEVYLIDMNIAKWYDPDETDDTRYMGTRFYAAPEQAGYGMKASSAKSDIYALGVLLNVITTGEFPKVKKSDKELWKIIEHCISLDAADRYDASELKKALEELRRNMHV